MTLAYRWTLLGVVALIALQFVWHGWLAPPRGPGWFAACIASLPLLAALALFLPGGRKAAVSAGMIALLYFVHGIMEAWADRTVWPLGLAEAGLATWVVFCSSWDGLQARLAARRKPPAAPV
jgi:uncharacterized membrane protein